MPPPRITRSVAAAERSRKKPQAEDELDPLTDLEELTPPTNVRSARKKLPVAATPSLRRR